MVDPGNVLETGASLMKNGKKASNGGRRIKPSELRSKAWFDNPDNADMTALYVERTMNFGLTLDELQSGKPIIGIAQSGSDLSPCNRHHIYLAERVREGIREAGGIAFEFPLHPIQETCKRPTASLDRNLAYLSLVEVLYGYPIDGVVLTTGCDKTTPSQIMAAATVDLPAIVLSGGPMLNGWYKGERTGSGTIVWKAREMMARGEIDYKEFLELVASSAPSAGHCNTMGTASTMNSLAEALGMSLPGCAAIPAPYRERQQIAYLTRQAHRRDGVGGPEALRRPDARGVRERHRRQLGDRRLDQRADPLQCHRAAYRRRTRQRRLGEARLRHPAARQPAAGRRIPRRGVSPRRWRAGGRRRADRQGQDQQEGRDRERADALRELRGQIRVGSRRHQIL